LWIRLKQCSPQLDPQEFLPLPRSRIQPWNSTQGYALQPELKSNILQRLLAQNRFWLMREHYPATLASINWAKLGGNWGNSPRILAGWVWFHMIESQHPTHRANQTKFGTLALEASGSHRGKQALITHCEKQT
jgi:hypothetical protein